MRKMIFFGFAVILIAVFSFAGLACRKKEEPPKDVHMQSPMTTQEEKNKAEAIKQGVGESRKIIVARVNGAEITMYSLIREMNAIAPRYIKPGQESTPQADEQVRKQALDMLIIRELAVQEAVRQGIKIAPETVETVLSRFKSEMGPVEEYKAYLKERGLSEEDLRKKIERDHLFETITATEVYQKIVVDEKMLRDEYKRNKERLVTRTDPPRQMSFEESRPVMERKMKAEIGDKKMNEWGSELRKKAKVEILPAAEGKTTEGQANK